MFDTIEDILKNKYINNLDDVAKEFDLSGIYVNYEKGLDSEFSGMYFVCGTDHDRIEKGDFDIREVINYNKRDIDFFNYGIMAFPLKDCGPFATHQQVLEHCRNAEFVQMIYREYNMPIPPKISVANLIIMKTLYANSRNSQASPEQRAKCEESLKKYFDFEDIHHNPQNPEYKKRKFITDKYYDTGKSKISNFGKRLFGRSKNKVSLEHLFNNSPSVEHMILNIKIVKGIKEEMKKHPEILYWLSKPEGIVLDTPEGQGFGPTKESNDTRTVDLAYSSLYKREMTEILNRICYPEAWHTNAHDMCSKYGDLYMVQVPETEYDNFKNLCHANNIDFCMDAELTKYKEDELTMIAPYKDAKMVDAIMCRLSGESEDFHISLPKINNDSDAPLSIDCSSITDPASHMLNEVNNRMQNRDFKIIGSSCSGLADDERW